MPRGQSARFLRLLRKKHRLGEFGSSRRRARRRTGRARPATLTRRQARQERKLWKRQDKSRRKLERQRERTARRIARTGRWPGTRARFSCPFCVKWYATRLRWNSPIGVRSFRKPRCWAPWGCEVHLLHVSKTVESFDPSLCSMGTNRGWSQPNAAEG